jgi:15-cis-phytoene synthase
VSITREMAETHCLELVRAGDKDRFLASLFAPDEARSHLLALYAFNIEIARVRELTSDPKLGEFRHQWWFDALDAIYARETPDHPVAQALAWAIDKGDLPKHALRNMIEARNFDLYDDPMPALNDLEGYLGETSSAILQMAALILAGYDALGCAETSGLAGVAYGLTGLLRVLPITRARGQCYVPAEMLEQRGLTSAHLIAARDDAGLTVVLAELRHLAAQRLREAREKAWLVPRPALPAFLPVSLIDAYLVRLARLGPKALHRVAEVPQIQRQWRLFRQARVEAF